MSMKYATSETLKGLLPNVILLFLVVECIRYHIHIIFYICFALNNLSKHATANWISKIFTGRTDPESSYVLPSDYSAEYHPCAIDDIMLN